jgi:hypothetical protein
MTSRIAHQDEKELEMGEELGPTRSEKSMNNLEHTPSQINGTSSHPNPSSPPPTDVPLSKTTTDVPPNGGYGWVCVAACATINAHTWGLNSSYAVFLAYYLSNNVFPGATPLHYAFIGGLAHRHANDPRFRHPHDATHRRRL